MNQEDGCVAEVTRKIVQHGINEGTFHGLYVIQSTEHITALLYKTLHKRSRIVVQHSSSPKGKRKG